MNNTSVEVITVAFIFFGRFKCSVFWLSIIAIALSAFGGSDRVSNFGNAGPNSSWNNRLLEDIHLVFTSIAITLLVFNISDYCVCAGRFCPERKALFIESMIFLLTGLIASILYTIFHERDNYESVFLFMNASKSLVYNLIGYSCLQSAHKSKLGQSISGLQYFTNILTIVSFHWAKYSVILEWFFYAILGFNMVLFYPAVIAVWVHHLYKKYTGIPTWTKIEIIDYKGTLYILIGVIRLYVVLTGYLIALQNNNEAEASKVKHCVRELAYIIGIVICMVLPLRLWQIRTAEIAAENLRMKRDFVRYASHEMRSPLNVVAGGLEMLRQDLVKAINVGMKDMTTFLDTCSEEVSVLIESTDESVSVLNNLLNYETIDMGKFLLEPKCLPLLHFFDLLSYHTFYKLAERSKVNIVLQDTARIFSPNETEDFEVNHNDDVEVFFGPLSDLILFIDKAGIKQLVGNLTINAIKFSKEGDSIILKSSIQSVGVLPDSVPSLQTPSPNTPSTNTPSLFSWFSSFLPSLFPHHPSPSTVKPTPEQGLVRQATLCIEVTDYGVGIARETQVELFGELSQFDSNKLQGGGGSGLGLWICRKTALAHGGFVGCTSLGAGRGSTFFLHLPVYSDPNAPHPLFNELTCASSKVVLTTTQTPHTTTQTPQQTGLELEMGWPQGQKPRKDAGSFAIASKQCKVAPMISDSRTNGSREGSRERLLLAEDRFKSSIKVLIVDDSSTNRKIMAKILKRAIKEIQWAAIGDCVGDIKSGEGDTAVHIEEADDGTTAILKMEEAVDSVGVPGGGMYDFVLMDYVMNVKQGPETAEEFRGRLKYTGHIIGVTGNNLDSDIYNFKSKGATHVLIKPLRTEELIEYLQQNRMLREN